MTGNRLMHRYRFSMVVALACELHVPNQGASNRTPCDTSQHAQFLIGESIPPSLKALYDQMRVGSQYQIDLCHLNPFYLAGDFDGDGRMDYAVRIRRGIQSDRGRLAVLRGSGAVAWLTPDSLLRYPGPGAWYVHPRSQPVDQGVGEGSPPTLRGDAIMMVVPETSSALVYWNGRRFVSYWQGD